MRLMIYDIYELFLCCQSVLKYVMRRQLCAQFGLSKGQTMLSRHNKESRAFLFYLVST